VIKLHEEIKEAAEAKVHLPVMLAKSEEILIIFAEEASDREGKKALEARNGP
jgi:hypothetical protein